MNNKKIFIGTVIAASVISGMLSCTKDLNQTSPTSVTTGNAYKTETDFTAATYGLYTEMMDTTFYGGSDDYGFISSYDIMADNLIRGSKGRGSQNQWYIWNLTSTNEPGVLGGCYSVVRLCNNILTNIDNLNDGTFKNNVKGQALAMRALMHFDLLKNYSKAFTGAQAGNPASDLGVPYVTTTDLTAKPSRPTMQATYDNIVADLNAAIDIIGSSNGVYQLNKSAVYGILSNVYLWGGEYQKCVDASTSMLSINSNVGSIANFPKIWTDVSTEGVIFELQNITTAGNRAIGTAYNQGSGTSFIDEYVPEYTFYQLFSNTDIRRASYTDTTSARIRNSIIKYYKKGDGSVTNSGVLNIKVLRVAGVLLNRAEAYYRLGNESAALTDVNALRSKRYSDYTAGTETGTSLIDAILLQRRLELAFEGDRWYTLKRLGLGVDRDSNGDLKAGDGVVAAVKTLAADDHRWLLPVSLFEITTNSNFAQNSGY